jgi:hypothetical protein
MPDIPYYIRYGTLQTAPQDSPHQLQGHVKPTGQTNVLRIRAPLQDVVQAGDEGLDQADITPAAVN